MVGTRVRLIGLGLVAMGAAFAWFFGFKPLWEAEAGLSQAVRIDVRLFMFAPLAMLFGLVMMVGGSSVANLLGRPETARDHAMVWPIFGVAMALGFGGWWWMESRLDAIGFVTGV